MHALHHLRGRPGRSSDSRLADQALPVLRHPARRRQRLRPVGAAAGGRRLDRLRRLLPGAALSVFPRRRLRDLRARPAGRPHHPGADRIGVVRAARPGRRAILLEAGRLDRGPGAGAVGAGDLLRRPAAEVGARRVLRVLDAVAAGTACHPAKVGHHGNDDVVSACEADDWLALGATMGALALTRENALVFIWFVVWAVGSATMVRARRFRTVVPHGRSVSPPDSRSCWRRSWRATTRSMAASISPRRSSDRTSTSATTRRPTAPTRRSGSAAARRSSSGIDATEVAEASVGRTLSPVGGLELTGPGARLAFITSQPAVVAAADRPQDPAARQPHRDARHREPGELRGVVAPLAVARLDRPLRAAGAARGARA